MIRASDLRGPHADAELVLQVHHLRRRIQASAVALRQYKAVGRHAEARACEQRLIPLRAQLAALAPAFADSSPPTPSPADEARDAEPRSN